MLKKTCLCSPGHGPSPFLINKNCIVFYFIFIFNYILILLKCNIILWKPKQIIQNIIFFPKFGVLRESFYYSLNRFIWKNAGRSLLMSHSFWFIWEKKEPADSCWCLTHSVRSETTCPSTFTSYIFVQCHSESRSDSKQWPSGSVKRYISLICSSIQINAPSRYILRLFWIIFFPPSSHIPSTDLWYTPTSVLMLEEEKRWEEKPWAWE